MNCKPGDLAIIIGKPTHNPEALGMIVEVLYAAPLERFKLPDGTPHQAASALSWVIRLTRPLPLAWNTVRKMGAYAVCPDSRLRPLPGEIEPLELPAPAVELKQELETA